MKKPEFMDADSQRENNHRYPDIDLNFHSYVSGRPHYPHPAWADALGIPAHCNRGLFVGTVLPAVGKMVLLESNHENRPLNDKRIRPLRLALKNGSYRDDSPDGFVIDWNWLTMNAQKRISAGVEANLPITLRIEYGVDPLLRPYIDASEWRKYHDRWQWTENRMDNKVINQMMALYFKMYSGMGTGSYSYDDALAIWEKCGVSMRWVAQMIRKHDLRITKDGDKSPSTVSNYLALAEFYRRDRQKAVIFANELYVINTDSKTESQQGQAYRRWLTGSGRPIVDQKELYMRAVYFMRRALNDEPVRYGVDKRIKGVSGKRGDVEAQTRKPDPRPTKWDDDLEDKRSTLLTVGKDDIAKELRTKHGITNVDAVLSAAALLNREGIGAQELKEIVLRDLERWCVAARYGKKLYTAIRDQSTHRQFSTAACIAFFFTHVNADDLDAVEPFFGRVTRRSYLRSVLSMSERGRLTYGFDSRLGKLLAYQNMMDAEHTAGHDEIEVRKAA